MIPHIHLGFIAIPSYALFALIGMICYVITTITVFEKAEKKPQSVTNKFLIISIFGFAALYAFAFLFNSLFHSIEEKKLVLGGITWLGGVLGGFPATILMIHYFVPPARGKALEYFDLMIPGITIAHGIGRIGCFFAGCCYGGVTDSVLGVSFPAGSAAALQYPSESGGSLPVIPTQLIEAGFEIVLFLVLIAGYKIFRNHFTEMYAFAYGTFRFAIEFFRGDDRGSTGMILTPSQCMSIVLIILGLLCLFYKKRILFKKLHEKMDFMAEQVKTQGEKLTVKSIRLLRELKKLCDDGIITEEEFFEKKKEILNLSNEHFTHK